MKKIYRYILPAAVAVSSLAACINEDPEPVAVREFPTFSASISGAATRATDDYWEDRDKIGISGGNARNVCHVTRNGDTLFTVETPAQQIYYQSLDKVVFTAYYPYKSELSTSDVFAATTADQTTRKSFDFLWAQAEGSKSSPEVSFLFRHKMSKVTFIFKNGENTDVVKTITKYRLGGFVMDGTFSVATGTCAVAGSSGASAATMDLESSGVQLRDNVAAPPLILFPQRAQSDDHKLEIFARNGQYFACNLTIPNNELVAGTNYTFTITVNTTGLIVKSASITDWISEEHVVDASSGDNPG